MNITLTALEEINTFFLRKSCLFKDILGCTNLYQGAIAMRFTFTRAVTEYEDGLAQYENNTKVERESQWR